MAGYQLFPRLTLFPAPHSPLRISHLRQRLRELGAKPCHEDRLLRGWSQVCSYDRKNSPAETFFRSRYAASCPRSRRNWTGWRA